MIHPGQMDLLTWIGPRSRRSDPSTSHEAGNHAAEFLGEHQQRILETLRASDGPMTSEAIALICGWPTLHPVARRMPELVDRGLVIVTDELGKNRSGRRAQRYKLIGR